MHSFLLRPRGELAINRISVKEEFFFFLTDENFTHGKNFIDDFNALNRR